jgi:hypothetical protein
MPTAAGIRFPQDSNQLFIFIIMLNSKVLALSIDQIMLIHFLFFYTSSLVAGPRIALMVVIPSLLNDIVVFFFFPPLLHSWLYCHFYLVYIAVYSRAGGRS